IVGAMPCIARLGKEEDPCRIARTLPFRYSGDNVTACGALAAPAGFPGVASGKQPRGDAVVHAQSQLRADRLLVDAAVLATNEARAILIHHDEVQPTLIECLDDGHADGASLFGPQLVAALIDPLLEKGDCFTRVLRVLRKEHGTCGYEVMRHIA